MGKREKMMLPSGSVNFLLDRKGMGLLIRQVEMKNKEESKLT